MSAKNGNAWMGSSYPGGAREPRGPWHYDGEIDLGFGAALRMAATVLSSDPIFGWFAYGGALTEKDGTLSIIPRDGLRQRFAAVIDRNDSKATVDRFKFEVDRDGFASEMPIVTDQSLKRIVFTLENRTGDKHTTELSLAPPQGRTYRVIQDGKAVTLRQTGIWDYPQRAELRVTGSQSKIEIVRAD